MNIVCTWLYAVEHCCVVRHTRNLCSKYVYLPTVTVGRNIKNKNTKIARSHKWLLAVDTIEDWQLYMMAKNRTFSTHRSTQPFKIKKWFSPKCWHCLTEWRFGYSFMHLFFGSSLTVTISIMSGICGKRDCNFGATEWSVSVLCTLLVCRWGVASVGEISWDSMLFDSV